MGGGGGGRYLNLPKQHKETQLQMIATAMTAVSYLLKLEQTVIGFSEISDARIRLKYSIVCPTFSVDFFCRISNRNLPLHFPCLLLDRTDFIL